MGDVLHAGAFSLHDDNPFRVEHFRIKERGVVLSHDDLVIEEANDLLDVAEIDGHVQFIAGKFLAGQCDLRTPGVAVYVLAMARIAGLAVGGVKMRSDDDLFHGRNPSAASCGTQAQQFGPAPVFPLHRVRLSARLGDSVPWKAEETTFVQHKPARIKTTDLSKTALVITAAGKGVRFGGYKQIAPLNGKPLIVHSIEAFFGLPFHSRIIVLPPKMLTDNTWSSIVTKYPHAAEFEVVAGKDDRAGSVRAGIANAPRSCEFIVVHDGVRPFPPLQAMMDGLVVVKSEPDVAGAIVCSPVTDTIKRAPRGSMFVQRTEDRDDLRRAETPQVAKRDLLMQALSSVKPGDPPPTDEAEALERMKLKVALFSHDGFNPKITTPQDLIMAQSFIASSAETQVPAGE